MKYVQRDEVLPALQEKSRRDIEAVNTYMDSLHGTVVSIQWIRSGQQRAYADSVYEALIFCHNPNVLTTNAPQLRTITEDDAKALARIFVRTWSDDPTAFLASTLDFVRPERNPCGLEEREIGTPLAGYKGPPQPLRSSCWRVQITAPYCD